MLKPVAGAAAKLARMRRPRPESAERHTALPGEETMKVTRIAHAALISLSFASSAMAQSGPNGPTYGPFEGGKPPSVSLPAPAPQTVVKTVAPGVSPEPEIATSSARAAATGETAPDTTKPAVPKPAGPAAAARTPSYAPGTRISGVAEVLDGHSMSIDGHAVRLHGAEAPGLLQTCQTASGTAWPCGKKAMERLTALAGGKKVDCTVTASAGTGAAALCAVRGIPDLGLFIVTEGFAVPNGHDKGNYSRAFEAARATKAGLWTGKFEAPWTWRRANP